MLRSMYSGISGMKVNQTKLDVIGNNIANASTTSFKASRARFSDMLSQSVTSAMAPSETTGGVNASQVGLGVKLASIDTIMTQGNLQSTGRALDVAIDQTGFFIVSSGPEISDDGSIQVSHQSGAHSIDDNSLAKSNSSLMYTRDGSFILDRSGNLLTGDGYRVMGYSLTNDDNSVNASSMSSSTVSAAGMEFSFGPGSQLNGYSVVVGKAGPDTPVSSTIDKVNKKIIINGDFSSDTTVSEQYKSAISKALSAAGISQEVSVAGVPLGGMTNLQSEKISDGGTSASATSVSFAGVVFQFTKGDELNGFQFKVGDKDATTPSVDITDKVITIDGKYATSAELMDAINAELGGASNTKIKAVSGNYNATENGVTSDKIEGGEGNYSPTSINALGLDFNFTAGEELNGYRIQVGTISSGTKNSATIDQNKKVITINGDFARAGNISVNDIAAAINKSLKGAGIAQRVLDSTGENIRLKGSAAETLAKTDGTIINFSGTESETTTGGTSVQSLNNDGTINFIDATGEIGAYDGSLKSLKIPETVRMAGSGDEVKVTSYTISSNGVINAVLENGRVAAIGQIAMASFKNPEGLTKSGGNIYNTSSNSGDAIIKSGVGTTGEDNSLGYGEMIQGMLEMSNVDLAEQFTEMIVSTRAFQASGKAINTGDEILQDIINLKR